MSSTPRLFRRGGRAAFVFGVALCLSASIWFHLPAASGCQKKVEEAEDDGECIDCCTTNTIKSKDKIRNGTLGEDEWCNQCYCIKREWKCEIKKCGCYPGAPIHVWMHNVRYACFCTLQGILNYTDCTREWFSIRKGRSVPSRLEHLLKDP